MCFANSYELKAFDLCSSVPNRPSCVLRSAKAYQPTHGVADICLPPASHLLCAGGRDGLLRVWDVRTLGGGTGVVMQSMQATSSFTMGVRVQERRAGAINVLTSSPCGTRLYAATDEGVVLGWDTRRLNQTLCAVRAGRAVCAGSGSSGIVALSHHPTLRHTLCAQLGSGACIVLDSTTAAVMALSRPLNGGGASGGITASQPGGSSATGQRAGAVAAAMISDEVPAAPAHQAPPSLPVDWRVRSRRGAWLAAGGVSGQGNSTGDGLVWSVGCANQGAFSGPASGLLADDDGGDGNARVVPVGLSHWRLNAHCTDLSLVQTTPTSSAVVCSDAHPRGHFLAMGLRNNSISVLAPFLHAPTVGCEDDTGDAEARTVECARRTDDEAVRPPSEVIPSEDEETLGNAEVRASENANPASEAESTFGCDSQHAPPPAQPSAEGSGEVGTEAEASSVEAASAAAPRAEAPRAEAPRAAAPRAEEDEEELELRMLRRIASVSGPAGRQRPTAAHLAASLTSSRHDAVSAVRTASVAASAKATQPARLAHSGLQPGKEPNVEPNRAAVLPAQASCSATGCQPPAKKQRQATLGDFFR